MKLRLALSLRSKFILIVLGGAVLPLALLGFWFTGAAERSGGALLRERLEASLGEVAEDVGLRWLTVRGEILRIAELPEVQAGLQAAGLPNETRPMPLASLLDADPQKEFSPDSALRELFADLQGSVAEIRILDAGGDVRWRLPADGSAVSTSLTAAIRGVCHNRRRRRNANSSRP